MASVLKVDKLDPQSGTALEIGTSGDTISVPSGATLDISASTLTPPATMPASSAANLTNIPGANITGTIAAVSGANLTSLTATNLSSGTVPTARLGSGTASSSTVLYGDQTYKAEPGGGKLGQLIQNVITAGNLVVTSTSFVASTHEVVITPSAATSNIFLMFSFGHGTQTDNRFLRAWIYRDIDGGGYSHLTDGVDGQPHNQGGLFKASASGQITGPFTVQFYDDPNTTGECTYKIYASLQDTTGTVNMYGEAGNYGYATAMEILA